MKGVTLYIICVAISVIAAVAMLVNVFLFPFPDWLIRVIGIVMLIDLPIVSFLSVKWLLNKPKS